MPNMPAEAVATQVVDAAIKVHGALGPGLLESAYSSCMAYELRDRKLRVSTEVALPVIYLGNRMDIAYRIDLLVEDVVIVELKAVTHVLPVHEAQLLSYLRLSHVRIGFLLNFHVARMKEGIKRMVNGFE